MYENFSLNMIDFSELGIKLYYSNFPYLSNPFFIRGGNFNNSSNAGLFYFNNANGGTNNNYGFRPVLGV